jgi:hypothetical protein
LGPVAVPVAVVWLTGPNRAEGLHNREVNLTKKWISQKKAIRREHFYESLVTYDLTFVKVFVTTRLPLIDFSSVNC